MNSRTPTNELAVVAVICAVAALATVAVPFFGVYLFWVFALPGVVFGTVGLRTGVRHNVRTGVAVTALALSVLSFAIALLWFVVLPAFLRIIVEH